MLKFDALVDLDLRHNHIDVFETLLGKIISPLFSCLLQHTKPPNTLLLSPHHVFLTGEQRFLPILLRYDNRTISDGGGLQLKGNPIQKFLVKAETRPRIKKKLLGILASLPDVSEVTFRACNLDEHELQLLVKEIHDFVNLKHLSVEGNHVKNITVLSSLIYLEFLNINSNVLKNISALSKLINLKYLNLYNNEIKEISPLTKMIDLTHLELDHNQIVDVRPLSALTNLGLLSLHDNQIVDVQPLSALTNLGQLWLHNNQIVDVRPLSALTNLWDLWLHNNQIVDVRPLSALIGLRHLDLDNNNVTMIRDLSSLINLKILYLHNNPFNKTQINALQNELPHAEIVT